MIHAALVVMAVLAAAPDNDVEWNGLSHRQPNDLRPWCPVNGETFEVRLQAYRDDLTAVRVRCRVDSAAPVWIDAAMVETRGAYDVWAATIPATGATSGVTYVFEARDGTDADYYTVVGGAGAVVEDEPPAGGFSVNFSTLSHAPLGSTPVSGGGAVFKVWAPNAAQAYVRGAFNGHSLAHPMTKSGDVFTRYISVLPQNATYQYFFEPGGHWRPDPRSRRITSSGGGYVSQVVNPLGYAWQSDGFVTPAREDLVIYELHVGTFAGRNDPHGPASLPATFTDVKNRVGHLVELGVNAVELTPINEFPWDYSAGYNPITQFAPESSYGTPNELKALIDELHANGIAVLLDIVWNHHSATDNILWQYDGGQVYYDTPEMETPWGPQLDFDRGEVRSYLLDSMHMWLDEYRIDGFRMDATSNMNIGAQEAAGWSLMQAYNQQIDGRYAGRVSIAEQLPNNPWITRWTSLGGAGFDAQWWDPFGDRLREAIHAAAFGDPDVGAIAGALSGGEWLSGSELCNYAEMHDEAWPSSGGQRLVKTIDPTFPHDSEFAQGRHTLAHGLVMFAPGVPMFLQGCEWLEDTDFGGGGPAGQDRIDWSKRVTYGHIFDFFKKSIRVKKENGCFRADAPYSAYHVNDTGNVLALHRWNDAGSVCVVIANFSNTDYTTYNLGLPMPGAWFEILNSQATRFGGPGNLGNARVDATGGAMLGHPQSASVKGPRMGLVVLRHDVPPCAADFDKSGGAPGVPDIFAYLSAWFAGDARADVDGNGVGVPDIFAFLSMWFAPCE